jgi:lactaldehyde dehydrogenase/glycolaldehyde dehydrogenase
MGVVACLIPFNYPVYTLLRKIAPALITGNTVVVRPSNNTPCSAFEIAQAVLDAGLPPGVVNILTMGHDEAQAMCTHPKVAMITLTGGVSAGRRVLDYSKTNIAKSSLELGGKTPAIVAADTDLDKAADDIVRSKTTNCGQLCTAVERVYVQRAVHDALVVKLRTRMAARAFGDRAQDASRMGPLISAAARQGIHDMVQRALQAGARLECGGVLPAGTGYFYPPTLLTGVARTPRSCRRKCSARCCACCPTTTSTTRWPWPATTSSGWPRCSTPRTTARSCRPATRSRPASSTSTAHRPTPTRATTPAGNAPGWVATTANTACWSSRRRGWW